jgi:hypothetical protein
MGARFRAPRFELAEIVRAHRAGLESERPLSSAHRRVLTDIVQCRTAVLGGHLDVCEGCDYEHPSYNSCRNRHCPKCQALTQQDWIDQRRAHLVDAPHFHLVFTLPSQLRPLAAFAPSAVYGLLFDCAAATVRDFARRRLGATLGVTLVLHTWDKQLRFHPHVHAIVSGGGLRPDGQWVTGRRDFLFPVKAMSSVFRGKTRAALRHAHRLGDFQGFRDFDDPQAFERLLGQLGGLNWYVYAKRAFGDAGHVLEYLGRYTHRVALSNSRILALSAHTVVLRTRGKQCVTLPCRQLLRRFLRHILPKGFHKIRHYGLYAGAPSLLAPLLIQSSRAVAGDWRQRLHHVTGRDLTRCPRCAGAVSCHALPVARAPPPPTTS